MTAVADEGRRHGPLLLGRCATLLKAHRLRPQVLQQRPAINAVHQKRISPSTVCLRCREARARGAAVRLVETNRGVYERVRAAGGTLYPVSAFPMSREDWRAHFGPAFARLADAKRTSSPPRAC